jgi:uncharacterized protein YndB with AHSA1/START domain
MRLEHTLLIEAPVEAVWALTVDAERWPEATPTITTVERLDDGPLSVGSQARIRQPAQPARTWTVRTLEAPHTFVWDTQALGMTMTGGHHLATEGDGCRNTLTLEVTGPLAGVLGSLLRRTLLKAITQENEGFKRVAEGH